MPEDGERQAAGQVQPVTSRCIRSHNGAAVARPGAVGHITVRRSPGQVRFHKKIHFRTFSGPVSAQTAGGGIRPGAKSVKLSISHLTGGGNVLTDRSYFFGACISTRPVVCSSTPSDGRAFRARCGRTGVIESRYFSAIRPAVSGAESQIIFNPHPTAGAAYINRVFLSFSHLDCRKSSAESPFFRIPHYA